MNKKFISYFLGLVFLSIAVTGIIAYVISYSSFLSALHVIFGFVLVITALLHLKNNWRSYCSHISKKNVLLSLFILLVLILGVLLDVPPLSTIVNLGRELRKEGSVTTESYRVITTRLSLDGNDAAISVDFRRGKNFSHKENRFLGFSITIIPQMAIWLEDTKGNYLETLFVTEKAGKAGWQGIPFAGKEVQRPAALPYWAHKRDVVNEKGLYMPTKKNPLPDSVTRATPVGSFLLKSKQKKITGPYMVMMEINKSFDYNGTYSEEKLEDTSLDHADRSFSGQPSLVYGALIKPSRRQQVQVMKLKGHGDPTGKTGTLFTDLSGIDSALHIAHRILVEISK